MAGLILLGGIGGGCVDDKSKSDLDPAGNPKILQVFVNDGDDSDDPFGYATYTLTYGVHPDANKCSFDKTCAEPLTCASTGDVAGHCVDSTGAQPIAENAPALGISIRIVSKELLDGKTLEEFVCACQGTPNGCQEGKDFSIDPANCSACGDDIAGSDPTKQTPVSEAGRCLDLDQDGLPDASGLQAGIATIACTGSAVTFMPYTTAAGDGYYYPSGNQFPTSTQGYGGLGPAIVLEPQTVLPSDVDCTVTLTAMAKDKDGHSFDAPTSPPKFHTTAMGAASTAPANKATNVATNLASIKITYNTLVAASSATKAGAVTVKDAGGAALAGIVVSASSATIKIDTSGATLKAATAYTVAATGITDTYGQPAADKTFTFTTK